MTDSLSNSNRDQPSLTNRVDMICDAFERELQAGGSPRIEDHLGGSKEQELPRLLRELLILELEYRRKQSEVPNVDDYAARFPDHVGLMLSVFKDQLAGRRRASGRSSADGSPTETGPMTERDTFPPENHVERQASEFSSFGSLPAEFGRYRVLEHLGQGAMGSVYLAHDTELGRKVALKVPKFRASEGEEVVERFYREARSSAVLRHAGICPVYDVGELSGIHFISMAYIVGRQLSDYVKPGMLLRQRQIALLVRKLAVALQEAHDQGIVHRDLKPSNIMIDEKREPIVMDFGLARQVDRDDDARLTREGALVGSPAYMSPEQVEGQRDKIGPACDIYSLGTLLYELITGTTPFTGSIAQVVGQIVTAEPAKPSERRADVDPALESICLKMMAKRIDDRFDSMKDVAQALTEFLRSSARAVGAESARDSDAAPESQKAITADDVSRLSGLAEQFMQKNDYAQAIQLLEEIPERNRTDEILELLDKAIELQDEVSWLLADIQDAISKEEYEGLLPSVKRLLELKPGHRKAKQLYAELTGKASKTAKLRAQQAKRARTTQSGGSSGALSWLTESLMAMTVVGVLAFGLVTWAVTSYLRSGGEVLKKNNQDVAHPAASESGSEAPPSAIVPFDSDEAGSPPHTPLPDGPPGLVQEFKGHTGVISTVAFSPDDRYALSGSLGQRNAAGAWLFSSDQSVRVWNVQTGEAMHVVRGNHGGVICAAFSPDGRHVLYGTGGQNGAYLWSLETGKEVRVFPSQSEGNPGQVLHVAFSPDSSRCVTWTRDLEIALWTVETGERLRSFDKPSRGIGQMGFSHDGRRFFARGPSGVFLWNVDSGKTIGHWTADNLSSDDVRLKYDREMSGCNFDSVCWESSVALRKKKQTSLSHWTAGRRILSCDKDNIVRLWDMDTLEELHAIEGNTENVNSMAFSSDGRFALSGGKDTVLRLWRLPKPTRGAEARISASPRVAKNAAKPREAVASNLTHRAPVRRLKGHTDVIRSVAYLPDGQ